MFVSVDHLYFIHIFIYVYMPAYLYIIIWRSCNIVFSELFLNAGRGDFRTENLSLGEFFFFFSLRWEQTEPLLFKPIVQWSREREETGEARLDWAVWNNSVHTSSVIIIINWAISVSCVSISVDLEPLIILWISKLTLSCPESSLNHFTSKRTCLTSIYNKLQPMTGKRGVSADDKQTHARSLTQVSQKIPLPLQVFTVCHNHKKTSSLRTNCASPNFLITSCSTTAPLLFLLKLLG